MRRTIVFVMLLIICSLMWLWAAPKIASEMNAWNQENNCISKLVSQGIERKDIKRVHGGCEVHIYTAWVEE